MAKIDEYDAQLLADHDLLEKFAAGESLTDEEFDNLDCLPRVDFEPAKKERIEALLHKRQFGLE